MRFCRGGTLLAIILATVGCSPAPKGQAPVEVAAPVAVKLASVTSEATSRATTLSGTFRSKREATLSSKLTGRISYLKAEVGDTVSSGATVCEIDTSDIQSRVDQAQASRQSAAAAVSQAQSGEAQATAAIAAARAQLDVLQRQRSELEARLELAQREAQRYSFLSREGAVPREKAEMAISDLRVAQSRKEQLGQQIEAAKVAIRQAEAALGVAQSGTQKARAAVLEADAGLAASASDLSYGKVVAPFRGIVVEKLAHDGELNTPGRPLIKLQDVQNLELWLTVPETQLEQIQSSSSLQAEVPSLKRKVSCKLKQVIASTDPSSRTFQVRFVALDAPSTLFPGTFAKVQIAEKTSKTLKLPEGALVHRGQLEGVFVARSDKAEFRLVQLGADGEILSGLSAGDQVVVQPPESLQDGQAITK